MNNRLDDKLIMQDCISTLKDTAGLYNISAQEAATKSLKNEYLNVHRKLQEEISMVFDEMSKKGWYQVQTADQQTINSLKTTISNVESSIGVR